MCCAAGPAGFGRWSALPVTARHGLGDCGAGLQFVLGGGGEGIQIGAGIVVGGMNLSPVWAGVFTAQAAPLAVAGVVRRDLAIRPRKDLSSGLGGVFIAYALVGYPL